MTEKMKQMADRVMVLDNYKNLCEERIKDLDPNHSFPVMQSHLGSRPVSM